MRKLGAMFFCILLGLPAFGQAHPELSLSVSPGGTMPLGENSSYFSFGGGTELTASLSNLVPVVSPRLSLGYDYVPLVTLGSVSLVHLGVGLAVPYQLTPSLSLSPYVLGGYTYGFISDGSGQGGGPFAKGGLELVASLGDRYGIGLDTSYRWDIGAWSGLDFSLYSSVHFPIGRSAGPGAVKGIQLLSADLTTVFPALFKLYD